MIYMCITKTLKMKILLRYLLKSEGLIWANCSSVNSGQFEKFVLLKVLISANLFAVIFFINTPFLCCRHHVSDYPDFSCRLFLSISLVYTPVHLPYSASNSENNSSTLE